MPFESIPAFKKLHSVLLSDVKSVVNLKLGNRDLLGFSKLVAVSDKIVKSIKDHGQRNSTIELFKS